MIYDLEALDPALMQNVVYNLSRNSDVEETGIIIQKLGQALAIHNDASGNIDVILLVRLRVRVSISKSNDIIEDDGDQNEKIGGESLFQR